MGSRKSVRRKARLRQPKVTPQWGDAFLNRRQRSHSKSMDTLRTGQPCPGYRTQKGTQGVLAGSLGGTVTSGDVGAGWGSSLSPGTGFDPSGAWHVLNACPLKGTQLGRCDHEPAGSMSGEHVLTAVPHRDGGMCRGGGRALPARQSPSLGTAAHTSRGEVCHQRPPSTEPWGGRNRPKEETEPRGRSGPHEGEAPGSA